METDDIRVEIDTAIRGWNSGPAAVSGRLLSFNPMLVTQDMAVRLKETIKPIHWKLTRAIPRSAGNAFRSPKWFRQAEYARRIELP